MTGGRDEVRELHRGGLDGDDGDDGDDGVIRLNSVSLHALCLAAPSVAHAVSSAKYDDWFSLDNPTLSYTHSKLSPYPCGASLILYDTESKFSLQPETDYVGIYPNTLS